MQEKVSLYFRESGSDKIYVASLDSVGSHWAVNFAYGRRGTSLNSGTKTNKPVDYNTAKKIYDKLVAEKTRKGYTPGEDGTPYTHTTLEERDTGIRVQLLNSIEEEEVQKYLKSEVYWMQEKYDGRRRILEKKGKFITAINRKGLVTDCAETIKNDALCVKEDFIVDGEDMGDHFYVFDVLEIGCENWKTSPYSVRFHILGNLFPIAIDHIHLVVTGKTTKEKEKLFKRLKKDKAEGIVFKNIQAPYTAGRPNSGGDQVKFKFYSTVTAKVKGINQGKRSASLVMMNGSKEVPVGNVTILPNFAVPEPSSLVEIRYLYFNPGGALYQPVYLGPRTDLDQPDDVLSLKTKKALEE